jgi:flagellin
MKGIGQSQATASARLSSGLKINSAADDAAGLAISEKMRAQIRGLDMASKNAQDGTSLVQTAEGGMQQITSILQRGRELTVQAANDTNDHNDRKKIADEIEQLFKEIDAMADRVEFNGKKLIQGSFATNGVHLQVGANKNQAMTFKIGSLKLDKLDLNVSDLDAFSNKGASGSTFAGVIDKFDDALKTVSDERAKLGAVQNRLEYTMKSLDISSENLSASESRIRDTDMAKEMMSLTRANVLAQAATSMLAQANQSPQNVLQIVR